METGHSFFYTFICIKGILCEIPLFWWIGYSLFYRVGAMASCDYIPQIISIMSHNTSSMRHHFTKTHEHNFEIHNIVKSITLCTTGSFYKYILYTNCSSRALLPPVYLVYLSPGWCECSHDISEPRLLTRPSVLSDPLIGGRVDHTLIRSVI